MYRGACIGHIQHSLTKHFGIERGGLDRHDRLNSEIHAEIGLDLLCSELQHLTRQCRLHADPEGVVHHVVCIGQFTTDAVVGPSHVGLTCQVARKEQASTAHITGSAIDTDGDGIADELAGSLAGEAFVDEDETKAA